MPVPGRSEESSSRERRESRVAGAVGVRNQETTAGSEDAGDFRHLAVMRKFCCGCSVAPSACTVNDCFRSPSDGRCGRTSIECRRDRLLREPSICPRDCSSIMDPWHCDSAPSAGGEVQKFTPLQCTCRQPECLHRLTCRFICVYRWADDSNVCTRTQSMQAPLAHAHHSHTSNTCALMSTPAATVGLVVAAGA